MFVTLGCAKANSAIHWPGVAQADQHCLDFCNAATPAASEVMISKEQLSVFCVSLSPVIAQMWLIFICCGEERKTGECFYFNDATVQMEYKLP